MYDVFQVDGRFLGRVHIPPNASFANASGNKVWLTVTTDLGVPTLVRYRIVLPKRD